MPPRGHRGGRGAIPPLRMASHNVRGVKPHLDGLVAIWLSLRLDIVLLQETHLGFFDTVQVERRLQAACQRIDPAHAGYKVFWCLNTQGNGTRSAGVAVLIKQQLLASGHLQVDEGSIQRTSAGRFMVIPLKWEGHSFSLANVYLPNDSPSQQLFLRTHLGPLVQAGRPVIVGGDWNFVSNTPLDRARRPAAAAGAAAAGGAAAGAAAAGGAAAGAAAAGGSTGGAGGAGSSAGAAAATAAAAATGVSEGAAGAPGAAAGAAASGSRPAAAAGASCPRPAQVLEEVAPDLLDAYRALHPTRRCFTFHAWNAASRIDRWYVSSVFRPHLAQCSVGPETPSDHRPVVLELLAKTPVMGPGVRRVRLQGFWGDQAARAAFEDFLQQEVDGAPQAPGAQPGGGAGVGGVPAAAHEQQDRELLTWWVGFKGRVHVKASTLSRQLRAAQQTAHLTSRAQEAAALSAAYDAVEAAATEQATTAALDQVLQARRAWCAAVKAARTATAWQRRRNWVHQGERPGPGLTAALQSQHSVQSRYIAGLQSPATGRLVIAGRPMAQLAGQYWANVSAAPPSNAAALTEVLQAVQASGLQLSQQLADSLGSVDITADEVRVALKHSAPGKAPGLDGLPVDIYRKCSPLLAPLLARVYSAMGRLGELPTGFLDGLVVTLYKAGPRTQPGNYRPITLLNSDYRVLAKVLATRLRAVQGDLIQPEQTGFLPGRHIGENIMLNQLLPAALPPSSQVVTIFLDFYKAYDTIIREFLYAVLEALGLGAGFIKWVKLLLTNTGACALINGYMSARFAYTAGVRQGCPLAPQLYLFAAQALLSFLKAKGFGVGVLGQHITASQFADDAQVYLPSAADLPRFQAAMDTFAAASGQRLNVDKSLLLPIGKGGRLVLWTQHFRDQLQQQQPGLSAALRQHLAQQSASQELQQHPSAVPPNSSLQGFPVVSSAKALGINFLANGTVAVDWAAKLEQVKRVFRFVSHLPLSVFGRGFASASYGISKLLYAAEFVGLPPANVIAKLETITGRLVDRQLPPEHRGCRFAGVAGRLLVGHPTIGGFGALPWREHILARHAMWGVRLITGDASTPWIKVARALLAPTHSVCPAWQTISIALCQPGGRQGPVHQFLPQPLQRLAQGLQSLPAWRDVEPLPLQLGPWCGNAPLWCNPFLVQVPAPAAAAQQLPTRGLEGEFVDLAHMSTLSTVQHALTALQEVQKQQPYSTYIQQVWPFWLQRDARFRDRQYAEDRLQELVDAIPFQWRIAAVVGAPAGGAGLPSPSQVWAEKLLPRLGWPHPTSPGRQLRLSELTVKVATGLQLQPILEAREAKHLAFLALACQGLPPALQADTTELFKLFKQLWRLPWENERKELFWRLTLDGLPSAARMKLLGEPCACGTLAPCRRHHFWECSVAQAVVSELRRGLAGYVGGQQLRPDHVWLARVPSQQLHAGLWLVISQAALLAMNRGRRLLTALKMAEQPLPAPARLLIARKVAATAFWDMLADFVGLALCPAAWLTQVPSQHPFLGVVATAGSPSLVLRRI